MPPKPQKVLYSYLEEQSETSATPQDFSLLAEKLKEASQALLAWQQTLDQQESEQQNLTETQDGNEFSDHNFADMPTRPHQKNLSAAEDSVTRSYSLPQSRLQLEQKLLKKYHAKDFGDLIEEANTSLVGFVKLMKSVHPDARFKGYVLSSLGNILEPTAALLFRMTNVYGKRKLQ